jgi:beta-galactosidase
LALAFESLTDRKLIGKGVLGHDLEPNRFYNEVSQTAHELQKIGPKLVNLKIKNKVAGAVQS